MHKVFVYGTLKAGLSNSGLLKDATVVDYGVTHEPYMMMDTGGYPVVIQKEKAPVSGEIYHVDDQTLARLDRLEGHPNFFRREEIAIDVKDSGILYTCWMYFGHPEWFDGKFYDEAAMKDGNYNWVR